MACSLAPACQSLGWWRNAALISLMHAMMRARRVAAVGSVRPEWPVLQAPPRLNGPPSGPPNYMACGLTRHVRPLLSPAQPTSQQPVATVFLLFTPSTHAEVEGAKHYQVTCTQPSTLLHTQTDVGGCFVVAVTTHGHHTRPSMAGQTITAATCSFITSVGAQSTVLGR